MRIGENTMKISELLEEKASCGCGSDCDHCGGKHTMNEVGKKCECCGNMIKAVRVNETTSAGSVAAVAGGMGTMQKRNMYNADGTMKNALDSDTLMAGKKKKTKSKKA